MAANLSLYDAHHIETTELLVVTPHNRRLPRLTPTAAVILFTLTAFILIMTTLYTRLLPHDLQPDLHATILDIHLGDDLSALGTLPCEWMAEFTYASSNVCVLNDWHYDGQIEIYLTFKHQREKSGWVITHIIYRPDDLTASDLFAMYGQPIKQQRNIGWISLTWRGYHASVYYDEAFSPQSPVHAVTVLA